MTILAELAGPDGAPIRFREAVPDDASRVLDYLRLVGGEMPNLSFGAEGPAIDEAGERSLLAAMAASDNSVAIVAEWTDRIVGVLTVIGDRRARFRHAGELGISVARRCWGVGVGRTLMQLLIDWACRSGVVRKLNLIVRADNARAIRLYESFGFVVEGRIAREILVDGVFYDSLIMGRLIDA